MTLDEWIDNNALKLRTNIECHLKILTDLKDNDRDNLLRMIMISVRQFIQNKEK